MGDFQSDWVFQQSGLCEVVLEVILVAARHIHVVWLEKCCSPGDGVVTPTAMGIIACLVCVADGYHHH